MNYPLFLNFPEKSRGWKKKGFVKGIFVRLKIVRKLTCAQLVANEKKNESLY